MYCPWPAYRNQSHLGMVQKIFLPVMNHVDCPRLSVLNVKDKPVIIMIMSSLHLEVVGERESGCAQGRHTRARTCFFLFLVPTTSKGLLRRLDHEGLKHFLLNLSFVVNYFYYHFIV